MATSLFDCPCRTRRRFLAALGLLWFSRRRLLAQRDDSEARVTVMRAHASAIRVTEQSAEGDERAMALRSEPLERYSDPPREIHDAALWAWGEAGRPRAVLKVEYMGNRPPATRWVYGLVALTPGRLDVQFGDGTRWRSTEPGLAPRTVPDAPVPGGTAAVRLAQMKALARRFGGTEDAGPARRRLQLRLMPRPLARYADEALGVRDGAIFAFAYGTNPDILLVIETPADHAATVAWQYAVARLGGGAPSVTLDGKEVWSAPAANPPAQLATYMNRRAADLPETP